MMNALKNKKKTIIIAIVCVLVVLNIMWTIMQNKFAPKLEETNKTIAALEQRVAKLEQGGFASMAELKEDFAAMKAVSDNLAERLKNSLKAEEDELANLESQVAAQKAKVDALKKATE